MVKLFLVISVLSLLGSLVYFLNMHDIPPSTSSSTETADSDSEPKRQKKRARSESQKRERSLEKHQLLPPCQETCKLKCWDNFDDVLRSDICRKFRSLNFVERRLWLDKHISIEDVKRRTVTAQPAETLGRNHTLLYTLPLPDGTTQRVCKTMFKATLGTKSDGIITGLVRAKRALATSAISPTSDRRGKHDNGLKKDKMSIIEHINSYNPAASHYTRANAQNRRYLDSHITITSKNLRVFKGSVGKLRSFLLTKVPYLRKKHAFLLLCSKICVVLMLI